MRSVDGITLQPVPYTAPIQAQPRRGRTLFIVLTACVLSVLIGVGFWVQPILAALPFGSTQEVLSLTQLLKPGHYLVLFQNPRELRPTGGFIGSFADVELGWGMQVKNIDVETNIYTRDAAYAARIAIDPPAPVKELLGDAPWAMRDANWSLDFPEAAQQTAWFYSQEGGRPVRGVVGIDARLLERLLTITGPIELSAYNLTLTKDNVIDALQEQIEKNYWQDASHVAENQPKQILADLLPQLLTHLKAAPHNVLLSELMAAFDQKELMIYSRDPALASTLRSANWDGHVQSTTNDYLYVNEANLTPVDGRERVVGAKSSWSIARSATLRRGSSADGNVLHTLTLYRAHQGEMKWPDGPNHSFLRIAVPAGATFVSATRNLTDIAGEIRLSGEAGKTVFGLWSKLNPGDSEVLTLMYETAGSPGDPLVLQRQPGAPAYPVELWQGSNIEWSGLLERDLRL